jgi:hypothetical protein
MTAATAVLLLMRRRRRRTALLRLLAVWTPWRLLLNCAQKKGETCE